MGKRVLISFLGTGTSKIVEDGIHPMRKYRKTLISYVCETNSLPWDDFDCREAAKAALRGKPEGFGISTTQEMRQWFKKHNNRRNGIAHTTRISDISYNKGKRIETELTPSEIIKSLEPDIKALKEIVNLV